ncbi:MAG: Rrf2 family transcriptional regulator [Hyphomicrobiaceae bacterium]|nr:Rrf2 family transcriptional regulator [Hyphomicrobiaceae bacterium]
MQLSSKGRYAVMAMADLARHSNGNAVPLAAISGRQQLSLAYLEQLFVKLRRAGLVESMRGPGGGYRLARDAHEISISAIMEAVEEPVKMTRCHVEDKGGCVGDSRCLTHDLWRALGNHIVVFLGGVSLGDVIDNATAREMAQQAAKRASDEVSDGRLQSAAGNQ